MCVSVGIYFGLVFRVKPNLEAASDRFSEILLLSASFSSCLALRHRKDQGVCPWTHTDWSEWLTRSEFRWSVLPASLNKPHTALPPRQHPRWHFLSPSSRSGSLGRSTLCCGSGVTQVTSWFLQEQWQPIGKEVWLHLGYFLAVSCCYNSLGRLEPTLGTSQSPAAREGRSIKVASSHLCSPILVLCSAWSSRRGESGPEFMKCFATETCPRCQTHLSGSLSSRVLPFAFCPAKIPARILTLWKPQSVTWSVIAGLSSATFPASLSLLKPQAQPQREPCTKLVTPGRKQGWYTVGGGAAITGWATPCFSFCKENGHF